MPPFLQFIVCRVISVFISLIIITIVQYVGVIWETKK